MDELFQEMILNNSQALYILRILENFENSLKIHFFIREMGANFTNFLSKQYKRAKADIDLMLLVLLVYLADIQRFKTA